MKKIIILITLSFLFASCDNLDDMPPLSNENEPTQNHFIKYLLGEDIILIMIAISILLVM